MSHRVLDRVQETTTSTGTGALVLAGAVTRMQSFSVAGMANGDTFWGLIEHASANEWEIALCTWATGGIVTRAAPLKSSTGSAVAFSAGTKTVSLISPASKTPYADNNGVFVFPAPISLAGIREVIASPAIDAGALTLALASSSIFTVANNANVTSLTISGATTGMSNAFTLLLTADGTPRTWTWPGSVTWVFGEPVLSSTNSKRDLFSFVSFDGGTTWLAFTIAQGF